MSQICSNCNKNVERRSLPFPATRVLRLDHFGVRATLQRYKNYMIDLDLQRSTPRQPRSDKHFVVHWRLDHTMCASLRELLRQAFWTFVGPCVGVSVSRLVVDLQTNSCSRVSKLVFEARVPGHGSVLAPDHI